MHTPTYKQIHKNNDKTTHILFIKIDTAGILNHCVLKDNVATRKVKHNCGMLLTLVMPLSPSFAALTFPIPGTHFTGLSAIGSLTKELCFFVVLILNNL